MNSKKRTWLIFLISLGIFGSLSFLLPTVKIERGLVEIVLSITSIFVIQMILLGFGMYFLYQGALIHGALLLGSIIPLFIVMVLKGKQMKEEYLEEYE